MEDTVGMETGIAGEVAVLLNYKKMVQKLQHHYLAIIVQDDS